MGRRFYTLLLSLLLPVAVAVLWWRGWRNPARRVDVGERLGRSQPRGLPRGLPWSEAIAPLWIHAVSVGEVQASAGLVAALRGRNPRLPILLTMTTATGRARAETLYRDALQPGPDGYAPMALSYAPFDLPGASAAFLDRVRPRAAIILETELWPNLLAACDSRAIPVALVSARLSERSVRRFLRFAPRLIGTALRQIRFIAAQSEADRARFITLGAEAARVQVAGNVKFDLPLPADLAGRGVALRTQYLGARRAWVAGSTHAGEEQQCLDAHRRLCAAWQESALIQPPPLLVLAPRHPERFEAVAQWLLRERLEFLRRSDATTQPDERVEVLLLDSLGELLAFYGIADIAFVGGSLVPVGGHNLLEPAALGLPLLAGPHSFNSPDAARLLLASGALRVVQDGAGLGAALFELFTQQDMAERMGAAALQTVTASRGAVERSLTLLEAQLPLQAS